MRHYRADASVRSWLCAIAWRKAKSAQRSWVRRRAREAEYVVNDGPLPGSLEDRFAVRQALLTLPVEQRAAMVLCLAEGFSHTEAAGILGMPLGTVKSYVARGRTQLLEVLRELPQEDSWQDGVEGDCP